MPVAADLAFATPLQLSTGRPLRWTVVFAFRAIISAAASFRGIAGISMGIARLFVFIFLVLLVASLVL